MEKKDLELITMQIADIVPYENNPRRNDGAVDAVVESIRQCGYIAPIIVDEDNVVLAGHTRLKALQQLGYTECNVAVVAGLTEEQKRKYRLLDNKTNEFAEWDFEMLQEELDGLDFDGFDFGFDLNANEDVNANDLFYQEPDDIYEKIDTEGMGRGISDGHYMKIDTNRIPLSDEEYTRIKQRMDEYAEIHGVYYGFVRTLL